MAADGFKEVTLLGQTVSSYYEQGYDFADLLRKVHDVEPNGSPFAYPNDFTPRLLNALAELPRVGHHIHLPVQAAVRDIKGYEAWVHGGRYLALIVGFAKFCRIIPSLQTSLWGTRERQSFQATLDLVRTVQFDGAFMFAYSERDGTLAARRKPDDGPTWKDRLEAIDWKAWQTTL